MVNTYQVNEQHAYYFIIESEGEQIGHVSLEDDGRWSAIIVEDEDDFDEDKMEYAYTKEDAIQLVLAGAREPDYQHLTPLVFDHLIDEITRANTVYMTPVFFKELLAHAEEEGEEEFVDLVQKQTADNGFFRVFL